MTQEGGEASSSCSSSSSRQSHGWTYHTFVSFRGQDEQEDLRHTFIGNLRHSLDQRGIRVFMDDEIRKGDHITETLKKSIQESQTAILVFSKYYATSSFCLRELVHIQNCIKGPRRPIWAVFYDVDPSDVRHQKGTYERAFERYDKETKENGERKYDEVEVKAWRSALTEAADICGWHWETSKGILDKLSEVIPSGNDEEQPQPSQVQQISRIFSSVNIEYEWQLREEIITEVSKVINDGPLDIDPYVVGLDSRLLQVFKLIQEPNVDGATMVGICGMSGIGKSTLAKVAYNRLAHNFVHLSFQDKINTKDIDDFVRGLLYDTIREKGDNLKINRDIIPTRLRKKKVLLVLDGVDKLEQLRYLAGQSDCFDSGSVIIITTTNKGLLEEQKITRICEVEKLGDNEAAELLKLHAFGTSEVDAEYKDVIDRAVKYADGHPLALEIMGTSNCTARHTVEEWDAALKDFEKEQSERLHTILRSSYDGLSKKVQDVFLDMACFYNGYKWSYVTHMLEASLGVSQDTYYRALKDRYLLKVNHFSRLEMHDQIQQMGREIVKEKSRSKIGNYSRLWSKDDILEVLKNDLGSYEIEAIRLKVLYGEEFKWEEKGFKRMKYLRQLSIGGGRGYTSPKYLPNSLRVLKLEYYPSWTLPDSFNPRNLFILNLKHSSSLQTLGKSMNFPSLRDLNLSHCDKLEEIPNISTAENLEILNVEGCRNLTKIDDSVGYLRKLKELKAENCEKLETFIKGGIKLPSLEILELSECSKLENFPEILTEMRNIKILALEYCSALKELPESIGKLVGLQFLNLAYSTSLRKLPKCIEKCHNLKVLLLNNCCDLGEISAIPPKLQILSAIDCSDLTSHSRSLLLSQALRKNGRRRFILPGNEIPKLFHKQSEGSSVSFLFRNKFPDIAICVVFQMEREGPSWWSYQLTFEFKILLNGTHTIFWEDETFEIDTDYIYLFDLKSRSPYYSCRNEILEECNEDLKEEWNEDLKGKWYEVLMKEEWNEVVINFDCLAKPRHMMHGEVKCNGVYVYNYEKCKADVDLEVTGPSTTTNFDKREYYNYERENRMELMDLIKYRGKRSLGTLVKVEKKALLRALEED